MRRRKVIHWSKCQFQPVCTNLYALCNNIWVYCEMKLIRHCGSLKFNLGPQYFHWNISHCRKLHHVNMNMNKTSRLKIKSRISTEHILHPCNLYILQRNLKKLASGLRRNNLVRSCCTGYNYNCYEGGSNKNVIKKICNRFSPHS